MNYPDDDDADERDVPPPQTIGDVVDQLRFSMMPHRYVDENSDISELLWQLWLEQRATRLWLITVCLLITLAPIITVVVVKIVE